MTLKRVTWVAPDLNEWANPKKAGALTFYVNVAFDDNDSGSIGKQDRDNAMELHGLLTEAIGKELEFGLESTGKKNSNGGDKLRITSFPGYEPVPYERGISTVGNVTQTIVSKKIEALLAGPGVLADPIKVYPNKDADIRAAVALKAAAEVYRDHPEVVLNAANRYYDWLTARPGRTSPRGGNGDGPTAPVSSDPDTSPAADEAGHGDGSGGGTALPTSQSAPQEPTSPPSAAIATAANTPSGGPTSVPGDHRGEASPTSSAAMESQDPGTDPLPQPATVMDGPRQVGDNDTGGGSQGRVASTLRDGLPPVSPTGCPPHQLNKNVYPKAGRYPCLKCGAWAK